MTEKNSKPPLLAISKDKYIRMRSSFFFEVFCQKKYRDEYEIHIWNMMVEISEILQKYFGEEGLAGQISKKEYTYNVNYFYPTTMPDNLGDKIRKYKEKIKDGTYKIKNLLGL